MADTSNKKNIREESLRDLSDFLTAQGEKAFRAKQIWQWIWQRGVTDFAEMSNLSKATRELLSRHYFFDSLFPQQVQTASDGTEKISLAADRRRNRRERTDSRKSKIHGLCIFTSGLSAGVQILCNRYPGF